jgi:hypothetical protein
MRFREWNRRQVSPKTGSRTGQDEYLWGGVKGSIDRGESRLEWAAGAGRTSAVYHFGS